MAQLVSGNRTLRDEFIHLQFLCQHLFMERLLDVEDLFLSLLVFQEIFQACLDVYGAIKEESEPTCSLDGLQEGRPLPDQLHSVVLYFELRVVDTFVVHPGVVGVDLVEDKSDVDALLFIISDNLRQKAYWVFFLFELFPEVSRQQAQDVLKGMLHL